MMNPIPSGAALMKKLPIVVTIAMLLTTAFAGILTSFPSSGATPRSGWGIPEKIERDDTGSISSPQVKFDAIGNAMAIWTQDDGSYYNVVSNRYVPGYGWGEPELVERSNLGSAYNPQIAFDGEGNAFAVWQQGSPNSIWANRYTVGSGWRTPELLEGKTGAAYEPKIAVDPSGNATVVWAQGSPYDVYSNRYTVGSGWGTAEIIEEEAGIAFHPDLAMDGSGNVIAIWYQYNGTIFDVWANRYTPGTGWGTAELIENDDNGNTSWPRIASDPAGNMVAVWMHQPDLMNSDIWSNR